jgi:hypothetical protein
VQGAGPVSFKQNVRSVCFEVERNPDRRFDRYATDTRRRETPGRSRVDRGAGEIAVRRSRETQILHESVRSDASLEANLRVDAGVTLPRWIVWPNMEELDRRLETAAHRAVGAA